MFLFARGWAPIDPCPVRPSIDRRRRGGRGAARRVSVRRSLVLPHATTYQRARARRAYVGAGVPASGKRNSADARTRTIDRRQCECLLQTDARETSLRRKRLNESNYRFVDNDAACCWLISERSGACEWRTTSVLSENRRGERAVGQRNIICVVLPSLK